MEELKEIFLKLGYNEEEFKEIISSYSVQNLKPETLIKKVKENHAFLISLGYSTEEIIKIVNSVPAIYSYNIENMMKKNRNFRRLRV